MKADDKTIRKQMEFIKDLTIRLSNDLNKKYPKHDRAKDDIRRIRREYTALSHMFDWDWSNEE